MTILVTGGAGFIGSNFILDWLAQSDESVVNLDKLTYAGNTKNLATIKDDKRYHFIQGDIADEELVTELFKKYKPRAILNFAAESHVDRSISDPGAFIKTNVIGTHVLLECAKTYYNALPQGQREQFRFLHVSTDEVYGSLSATDAPFSELNRYEPNSPYSASKASSDHLVRAYYHTYGLPTLTTNCSNNYGPLQYPEKFIPLAIHHALTGKAIPIYGDGLNIRDWLYVSDHCTAIRRVLETGQLGEVYNIGGSNEKNNLEVIHTLCDILDSLLPRVGGGSYKSQIQFVKDRAGHDRRYAIDSTKIQQELGWKPEVVKFEDGLEKTVKWYVENSEWIQDIVNKTQEEEISDAT